MSLLQSVFDSCAVRSVLIHGPPQCGKTSCGFSMAYEEAKNGGTPLFLCHKSHFEGASPNLPIPVRIGHAPLHKTLFRPDVLDRINVKYFGSWQDLLSLLITIQHATVPSKPFPSPVASSSGKDLERPTIPFSMMVIDDVHLVLPISSDSVSAQMSNRAQHSSSTPLNSNMMQLLLLVGLVHDTIQFQRSVANRNQTTHNLKAIVLLEMQKFPSQNNPSPSQALPTGIQNSFDVCVSFVPDGMQSYQVVTATRSQSQSRQTNLLAQKTVLLVPRESENKILVFLPPAARIVAADNESQERNDSMMDTHNSHLMDDSNTF